MGVVSHVNQEVFRRPTTLSRARRVRLESIPMSRDHHRVHLGVGPASTRPPRGNLPSSPAPASPVPSTSTLPTVASRSTTALVRPASSAPQEDRALPVPHIIIGLKAGERGRGKVGKGGGERSRVNQPCCLFKANTVN